MKTADEILKTELPGDLFSQDSVKMKQEYQELTRVWHPDIHKDKDLAHSVMLKINDLYSKAKKLISNGKWERKNYIQLKTVDGKSININFLRKKVFELGTCYILRNSIIYLIEKKYKRYSDNYRKNVSGFTYTSDKIRNDIEKYLPTIQDSFETAEHYVIVVKKTQDVFSVQDILEYYKGNIPDRHVAWILSSLYNLACYLDSIKVVHNGINLDSVFISPQYHSVMLLGGWWYAVPGGSKMIGAPLTVHEIVSVKTKADKISTHITDLDSIRQLGRQLLGDRYGGSLLRSGTLPKSLVEWLLGSATGDPIKEYRNWYQILEQSYGKRTFIPMEVTDKEIYVD